MVRSKDVPKKPRDPLLTPPSKLRGVGFLGDGGRVSNRGGTAMSPAPASVPNYMRGTSSSDAKGGRRRARLTATAAPASASPARRRTVPAMRVVTKGKVLFPEAPGSGSGSGPGLGRATCSSTLKGDKFPDVLDLAPGATDAKGPAAMRVCPYTYCSLNGHAHAPAVPLRSFLASRRRLIKAQQSMKVKGVSAFRKKSGDKNGAGNTVAAAKVAPLLDEEAVGDFFVEVYAGPRLSSGSDMSLDEMDSTPRKMEFLVFDRCGADEDGKKGEDPAVCGDSERDRRLGEKDGVGAYGDSSSVCSGAVISGDFIEELPWLRYHGSEYDSLDDGITEEQRMRDDEIDRAQISEEQGGNSHEGTSDELGDECEQEAAEEDEANGEDSISNSVLQPEIAGEQEGIVCSVQACQELDRRDEDNISDALCDRAPSAGRAQISEEQGLHSNEGTSDELGDECEQEEASEEHEANDEDSISNSVLQSEIAGELEGVVCRVEACQELDTRDEDSILDALCHGEPSAEQATAEGRLSDAVGKSDIPDRDVAEREDSTSILEESCVEEISADQDAEDNESSVKSDGRSEVTPDDDSEMEISDASNDGCGEDFSEEVTSKTVAAEDVFEQHDSIADENGQSNGQKESGITMAENENASQGSGIVCNIVDNMEDDQKEMEVTTYEKEESCEDSDTAHGSNNISTCFDDDDQMEPKVATYMSKDASVESDVSQGSSLDGNTEYVEDGTEMGPEITRCKSKLEVSYEEPGVDQGTVENDESVCVKDDAQNDYLEMTEGRLGCASKDPCTIQEVEQSDSPANVRSGGQNESNHTTNELAFGISEDTENESKPTICQPEDVSEESGIGQESDHDGSSANILDDTQNESDLRIFESEGAQECSDVVKDKSKDNSADSEKELENAACESGGASKRAAMFQEADSAQEDTTLLKLGASEDIQTAEETNELFNVEIPASKSDCMVEGHVEPQNTTTEVTDAKEPSIDDICDAFRGMNLKGDAYFDPDESATCPRNKLIISRRRRTPEEDEYMRGFNPRAPNFLPVELDPDSEKVDLRHQMVDERKNAEEWMIDYALRRALTNLAPARKKKVKLLVQAFETVLPHDEDDRKSVTPPRPVQSCN